MVHKNALLVVHDVYQDFNQLPLWAGYLASFLEKNGYTAEIYCMDVYHYTNEQLAQKLEENDYDLIGVGYMAARFVETIVGLCETINKHKQDAWLVLGGPGPSPIPRYSLWKTQADVVVMGEAEETFLEVLECKLKKGNPEDVKGIAFRKNDDIIQNKRRIPPRLNELPLPAWHLFPMDIYINKYKAPGMTEDDKMLSMITSRGCINRCSFCYRMEQGYRVRKMENVIEEMKLAEEKCGITYFFFLDELFVVSEKRVLDFERLLKEAGLKIKFTVEARVDIFNETIAKSLKRAGCQYVNIGFESSDQKVLDSMGKNTTIEQNIRALDVCNKIKLPVGLNFIWNLPGDTKESLFQNVEMIKKYNQYHQLRTIRPVTPYPGSELYYYAIRQKLLEGPEDFFQRFKNSDLITVNFMGYSNKDCYDWLFEANKELILDHYRHTNGNMEDAEHLIQQFKDLYTGKITKFRGARIYDKKKKIIPEKAKSL